MNTKKIIIILIIVLIILGLLFFIVNLLNKQPGAPAGDPNAIPTAIIVPTRDIAEGGFDIVAIDPIDQTKNTPLNQIITITFSRSFQDNEITFSMAPATPFITKKEGNKLIISPQTSWDTGTQYAYSINFAGNNEKVRLYRFTTAGSTPEYLPDTQPQGAYEKEEADLKENHTDYYVNNNTPYETGTFSVVSEFNPNPPDHFFFIVTSKATDKTQARNDFNIWLQSLDLSNEQIGKLDIQYK
jgi:hypothetical protein